MYSGRRWSIFVVTSNACNNIICNHVLPAACDCLCKQVDSGVCPNNYGASIIGSSVIIGFLEQIL